MAAGGVKNAEVWFSSSLISDIRWHCQLRPIFYCCLCAERMTAGSSLRAAERSSGCWWEHIRSFLSLKKKKLNMHKEGYWDSVCVYSGREAVRFWMFSAGHQSSLPAAVSSSCADTTACSRPDSPPTGTRSPPLKPNLFPLIEMFLHPIGVRSEDALWTDREPLPSLRGKRSSKDTDGGGGRLFNLLFLFCIHSCNYDRNGELRRTSVIWLVSWLIFLSFNLGLNGFPRLTDRPHGVSPVRFPASSSQLSAMVFHPSLSESAAARLNSCAAIRGSGSCLSYDWFFIPATEFWFFLII